MSHNMLGLRRGSGQALDLSVADTSLTHRHWRLAAGSILHQNIIGLARSSGIRMFMANMYTILLR